MSAGFAAAVALAAPAFAFAAGAQPYAAPMPGQAGASPAPYHDSVAPPITPDPQSGSTVFSVPALADPSPRSLP